MTKKINYDNINFTHPKISFSEDELTSLQEEWNNKNSPRFAFLKGKQLGLLEIIDQDIYFPPEGGNHNQWYQCEPCQFGLKQTGDDDHLCDKCGTIYHGQPYVGVIYRAKHVSNLNQMYTAAIMHHLDNNPKYFEYAKKILLGYAQRYSTYEFHDNMNLKGENAAKNGGHILPQTLDESVMLCQQIAPAFDLLYNDLTNEEIETIQENLIKPILGYLKNRKSGISNWQSWHNDGLLYGGYMTHDKALIELAISDKENGFLYQLDHSINDAGMWHENSWAYHDYAMSALTYFLSGTQRMGISLWDHPKVQLMYESPLKFKLSNGDLPRIGDCVEANLNTPPAFYSAACANLTDRSKVMAFQPKTITFENLNFKTQEENSLDEFKHQSDLIQPAGMVILRNNQQQKKLGVSLNFAEFGGFHGHFDKLSFTLHAYDQELGVDPGRSESQAYRLPIHKEWYRATFSHNTIMIDSKDQEGVEGELISFSDEAEFSYSVITSNNMYPGVNITRNAILTGSHLIIFDQIYCKKATTIDWLYHNHGQKIKSPANTKATLDRIPGIKYINDLQKSEPLNNGSINFLDNNINMNVHFAVDKKSTLYTGNGLYKSTANKVPMMILSSHQKSLNILSVFEPLKHDETSKINDIHFSCENEKTTIQIRGEQSEELFSILQKQISYIKKGN